MTGEKPIALHTDPVYLAALAGLESDKADSRALDPAKCSIAVLPFDNMSGDAEQEFFADGLAEDLLTELSRYRHLAVVSRNSSFVYKGKAINVNAAGRELGADFIVEGSVRKAGSRVRVTAQLIDTTSGKHVWAERYDRQIDDIFELQDEIVTAIIGGLTYNLDVAAGEQRRRNPTSSSNAYTAFLQARAAWRLGDEVAARDVLTRAVEIDPDYARALAYLAFFHSWSLYSGTAQLADADVEKLARDYAARGLAADPADHYVLERLAMCHIELGETVRAGDFINAALKANPRDIETRSVKAFHDICIGQTAVGLTEQKRIEALEPHLSPGFWLCVSVGHHLAGDYQGALDAIARIVNPRGYVHIYRANYLAMQGEIAGAREVLELGQALSPARLDTKTLIRLNARMLLRAEDQAHWLEGYRKAGVEV